MLNYVASGYETNITPDTVLVCSCCSEHLCKDSCNTVDGAISDRKQVKINNVKSQKKFENTYYLDISTILHVLPPGD